MHRDNPRFLIQPGRRSDKLNPAEEKKEKGRVMYLYLAVHTGEGRGRAKNYLIAVRGNATHRHQWRTFGNYFN